MNHKGILVGIVLCLAVVMSANAASRKKNQLREAVNLFNEGLGQPEEQMRTGWGQMGTMEQSTDGQKHFIVTAFDEGRFTYIPGRPGYGTATTTGQIDDRGRVSATTTTTDSPPVQTTAFYMHYRTVFYFDAEGKVYRWEGQECSAPFQKYTQFTDFWKVHVKWEPVMAWELRADKKGNMKPVNVAKYHGLFWR